MPALTEAVPRFIDLVTVLADADVDGRRHAAELTRRIRARGIETRLILPSRRTAA
jgi:hypothetical protein